MKKKMKTSGKMNTFPQEPKRFTKELKSAYPSHKVLDFYDRLLDEVKQEDDTSKLYWLNAYNIGSYLDIAFRLSIANNWVDDSFTGDKDVYFNTGLIKKDEGHEVVFKLTLNFLPKTKEDSEKKWKIKKFEFDIHTVSYFQSNIRYEDLDLTGSPKGTLNSDDNKLPSYDNLDISILWDEEAIKEGIKIRRKELDEHNINFESKFIKDIEFYDFVGQENSKDIEQQIEQEKRKKWLHLLIDGCDNLPLHLLRGLVVDTLHFNNDSKLLKQFALLSYNTKDEGDAYERLESLKNIIDRQIKHSLSMLKEKDCIIDLLPFYYLKHGYVQYLLPLYFSRGRKPDAALIIDDNFRPKTILNINEARLNYGFFRYFSSGQLPAYKDDWIKP